MQIIDHPTDRKILNTMMQNYFGDMVKAVVDIELRKIGVDAELQSDIEEVLLSQGSSQYDLWGINLYPEMDGDDFIEFDSMINIRPSMGNRSSDVQNADTRQKIIDTVNYLFT